MAGSQNSRPLTFPAGSDLSGSQYRFMVVNASGQLAAPSSGAAADGVLVSAPAAAGRPGSLEATPGTKVKLVVEEQVTVNQLLTPGTGGKARVASTTGDVIGAKAVTAGSGDGSVIEAILKLQVEPTA